MQNTTVPLRRRRHSGSGSADGSGSEHSYSLYRPTPSYGLSKGDKATRGAGIVEPPPRPKSTPGERPTQRRRQKSPTPEPTYGNNSVEYGEEEWDGISGEGGAGMDVEGSRASVRHQAGAEKPTIDHNHHSATSPKRHEKPVTILKNSNRLPTKPTKALNGSTTQQKDSQQPERPTKPLPTTKTRLNAMQTEPYTPIPKVANPAMLPVQAQVQSKGQGRKLYVILEQACLEAYKLSSGSKGGRGKEGEAKYTLLNCDDHQGILAKTGRDIADARPDITHQVRVPPSIFGPGLIFVAVSPHSPRLALEQGWAAPSLRPHRTRRAYRGQPPRSHSPYLQAFQRPHG
jgi:rRNA small subunit pseudouridine methyltransferase Nep1